jgi:hypothetical protein
MQCGLVDLAAPPEMSPLSAHHGRHSEVKLEAELKLPGYVRGVRDLAEIGVLKTAHRNRPHRCVGCVEHLEPKFHSETLCERKLSEY